MGLKYIIAFIDSSTCYEKLFPKQMVLSTYTFRFTAPLEQVTDVGSQFVNDMLTHWHQDECQAPYNDSELKGRKWDIWMSEKISQPTHTEHVVWPRSLQQSAPVTYFAERKLETSVKHLTFGDGPSLLSIFVFHLGRHVSGQLVKTEVDDQSGNTEPYPIFNSTSVSSRVNHLISLPRNKIIQV